MLFFKQSEATSARKKFWFVCVDDTDGKTAKTGLTFTGAEVQIIKTGGAFASMTNIATIVERTDGLYEGELTAEELDTLGPVGAKIEKATVRTTILQLGQVVPWDPYALIATAAAQTTITAYVDTIETTLASMDTKLDTIDNFLDTEIAQIADDVADVAGLLHRNSMVDNTTYVSNFLISARIRVFANAAALASATPGAANGANGEIRRYTLTGIDEGGGKVGSFKISRDL